MNTAMGFYLKTQNLKLHLSASAPHVICIGEMLADFVPEGRFHELRPGGAPSNVAINLARLGLKTSIISKVGDDFLGEFLVDFAKKNHVDVRHVSKAKGHKTGLVFVFLKKNKERDFSFYGSPSADTKLSKNDVKPAIFKGAKILHFGSISMMTKSSAQAVMAAVRSAKKAGALISYDPNVRLNLWEGRHAQAKKLINSCFKYSDIVKLSDAELKFLFNARPEKKALSTIFGGKKLVLVSAGKRGCYAGYGGLFAYSPAKKTKVVDTTGAGDAFMAGALYELINKGLLGKDGIDMNNENLMSICRAANKLGSIAVGRKGAV